MMNDELKLWEYHKDYETWLWYQRFRDFYLPQTGRRTLIGAYRAYEISLADSKPAHSHKDPDKITAAPATWRAVSAGGNTTNNKKIEGWVTWAERADSYYINLESTFEEVMHERRIQSSLRSLERIDRLGDKWEEMFKIASTLKKTRSREIPVETIDEKGDIKVTFKTIETRALAIGDFRHLIAAHEDLRTQERREMSQPARIYQSNHADNEGNNLLDGGLGEVLATAMQNVQKRRREEADNNGED